MKLNVLQKVYNHLGDKRSKDLFMYRALYSISENENDYIKMMAMTNEKIAYIFDWLESHKSIVIYGSGYRGKQLLRYYPEYDWNVFMDKIPKESSYNGYDILSEKEFWNSFTNQSFVISSRFYADEMISNLVQHGVDEKQILNYGKILDEVMHDQYFDLPELEFKEEYFVDLGCLDAFTDIEFEKRIGKDLKYIYVFEPDEKQLEVCKRNLKKVSVPIKFTNRGGAGVKKKFFHFQEMEQC